MRPIKQCLNKQLSDLYKSSMQANELFKTIAHYLPLALSEHCHVGSYHKGCLVLTTTNATWASQLRYLIPELRDTLRKEANMYQLSSIKISIVSAPVTPKSKLKASIGHKLSDKAKQIIYNQSQGISYEPLQQALFQLAKSSRPPNSDLD